MRSPPSRFYSRRRFIKTLMGAGLGASAADLWASDTPFPDRCDVRIARIPGPAGWSGKTIVFITDLHYGNHLGAPEAAALNAIVRRQKPDLILLGGDLADTPTTPLGDFFSRWSPGCPTFFSPGNHDLEMGATSSPVLRQAAAAGVTVLCNASEIWAGLVFIGLPSALRAPQDLSLLKQSGMKIILAHEPDTWDWSAEPDSVRLAGHTHGGQMRFWGEPIYLPTLGNKYPLGRFLQENNRMLLVSAGVGCTGPPVRLNCPPEICRLEFI